MHCPNCNSEISDEAQFCPKCGFNLKINVKTSEKAEASPHINVSPTITASGSGEVKVDFAPNITFSSKITTEVKNQEIGSIGEVLSEGAIKTGDIGILKGSIGATNKPSKKCPNCGKDVSGDEKFCPECGEQINK
jgi:rRNA maturation endonuclease Nob1